VATGAYVCFEDESGLALRPPKARPWGRRGHTPTVVVPGKGSGRVSIAGLLAYRPGYRTHRYYRLVVHHGRRHERRSMSEHDYTLLVTAAHQQLHAPLILIWDNLNTYVSKRMRAFLDSRTDWLTVVRLPAYPPESEASEDLWDLTKRPLGNTLLTNIDALTQTAKTHLKRLQYHPDHLDGYLTPTGLTPNPPPP
jgi:hypothetical protein